MANFARRHYETIARAIRRAAPPSIHARDFALVCCVPLAIVAAGLNPFSRPCPTEDSAWCYWDAATQGNGLGRSFVVLWEPILIYLN